MLKYCYSHSQDNLQTVWPSVYLDTCSLRAPWTTDTHVHNLFCSTAYRWFFQRPFEQLLEQARKCRNASFFPHGFWYTLGMDLSPTSNVLLQTSRFSWNSLLLHHSEMLSFFFFSKKTLKCCFLHVARSVSFKVKAPGKTFCSVLPSEVSEMQLVTN